MNFNYFLIAILFSTVSTWCCAKTGFVSLDTLRPEVGKPCPEFTLKHVTHYTKKQVTLNDFKGKWLFLDFWFTGCTTCIKSFPKINELQQKFKDDVQFLMVGQNDKKYNKNIEEVFEKLTIKQGLNITSAYDSILAGRWDIRAMPHIVIIDPQGIVRYITDGRDMTKEKMRGLLNGESVTFYPKDLVRPRFDGNLIGNNGSYFPRDKILYHSILTKWNGEDQNGGYAIDRWVTFPFSEWEKGFQFAMVNLHWLYNTAYLGRYYFKHFGDSLYGKVYHFPVLELQDSTLFEYSYGEDFGKGLYNYSLLVPSNMVTKENIMKYMQQDLARTFNFLASVEIREMPVWKLVAKPGTAEKIKTKGGITYNSASEASIAAGFEVRNFPINDFKMLLCFYLNETERHPFIDGTGIKDNIDIKIDADLTNLQDVKIELQKKGMDLIKAYKRMKVLVVRDVK